MTMKQQWQYLNLTRNSFYILSPAKGIMRYWQIISRRLYIRLQVNNFNVNYLKIPRKHRGQHKTPSRATCGPRV